jgi:glycosyltransferase involved in cell wall biosynthesis
MSPSPLVTICLPVYNGQDYLSEAIDSALAQTFADFELLIVDDCSTDKTQEIAKAYTLKDNRVKVARNEHNLGLFLNYNKCMTSASGKFIKLFAHDDLLAPDILERTLAIFEREPTVALVAVGKRWIDKNGHQIEAFAPGDLRVMRPYEGDTRVPGQEAICQTLRKMANWLGEPCSQMFKREHIGTGFDTRFKQIGDLDFSYRLLAFGDYYYLADQLCSFRKHDDSNSQQVSRSLDAWLDWFVLGAKHREYLPKAGLSEDEYCQLLTQRLAGLLHEARFGADLEAHAKIVNSFLGADALSNFVTSEQSDRANLLEYKTMAVLAILEVANLQEERRLAQNQLEADEKMIQSIRDELAIVRQSYGSQIEELRNTLDSLGNSASWRATALLRNIKRIFPS